MSRDRSAMETRCGVRVFALALLGGCVSLGQWLPQPLLWFPLHETRGMLLFHSRENARDRDGWVVIICWKCPLVSTDSGGARVTLLLAIRS